MASGKHGLGPPLGVRLRINFEFFSHKKSSRKHFVSSQFAQYLRTCWGQLIDDFPREVSAKRDLPSAPTLTCVHAR